MLDGNNRDENPPLTVEERYETACAASTLRVQAERGGPADMLIAAGWSEHQTGMALLRLHSEWTGAAKPRRVSAEGLAALEQGIKLADEKARVAARRKGEAFTEPGAIGPRARAEAARWYSNELRLLTISLKSRPTVWAQLLPWARDKGIPEHAVAQALFYWLDPVCGHCGGHGLHKAKDAPALSAKRCTHCNATGTKKIPKGGGRVLSYISHCTSQARSSIGKRLRACRE